MNQEKIKGIQEKARAFTVSEEGAKQLEHTLTSLCSGSNPFELNELDAIIKDLATMSDPVLLNKHMDENKDMLKRMVYAARYKSPEKSNKKKVIMKVMNSSQLLNAHKSGKSKATGQKTDTAES